MPEDGHYDQNMYHVLTSLIKFVMVDCSMYVSFKMIYHDGINFTIIFTKIKLSFQALKAVCDEIMVFFWDSALCSS